MRIQLSTVLSIVEIRLSDLVSGRYGDTSKSVNGIDTHLLVHLTVSNDRAENRNQLGRPQVAHRLQYGLFLRVVGALFKQRLQLLPPHNIPLGRSLRFPNVCNRRYLSNIHVVFVHSISLPSTWRRPMIMTSLHPVYTHLFFLRVRL